MSNDYNYAASLAAYRHACDNIIFEHMAMVFIAGGAGQGVQGRVVGAPALCATARHETQIMPVVLQC